VLTRQIPQADKHHARAYMIFLLSIALLPPRKLSSVSKKEICMLHYFLTSYFSCMFVHIGVLLGEVAEMLCGGIALARCGFDLALGIPTNQN
jgi:hypothetical protein